MNLKDNIYIPVINMMSIVNDDAILAYSICVLCK